MRRNNEEFKAEIFSRSEKIIAKRKRVKQIVVCCVPLVLCVFLTTYVYFSNNGVKAESAFDGAENIFDGFSQENNRGDMENIEEGSIGSVADKVETSASGTTAPAPVSITVTDCESGVTSHMQNAEMAKKAEKIIEDVIAKSQKGEKRAASDYNLTVSYSDNSHRSCIVSENMLICDGSVYVMQSADYDNLLSLIDGIIH